ncbi:peptidase S8 [Thermosipho sp. 1063]|uniref:S8 family serine peptidase n=1 Tax=unclassified Thermosipho (in: thermotogales) TaxID=2676525 RepID=UPI0009493C34|nr:MULTISPECIES: S8 family serine peptidase [unclassified Thermosipho (in: thermotogales)]ANQ54232.1 peptidase S8 [Thermosipho sp. 1070]APT72677.1 peptidase S8 [Thermosipho sp. 1063]OOC42071.1 hypothetical protein XO08_07200 [Thermosipho sp. 1074]
MRKSLKFIFPLILIVFLIFSSCGLNSGIVSNPENNNVNNVKFGSLEEEHEQGKVLVGYENREDVEKVVEALNGKISVDLPQIKVVSIKFDGTVKDAYEKIMKLNLKGLKFVEPSYKRWIIDPKPVSDEHLMIKSNGDSLFSERGEEEFSKYLWGLEAINVKAAWDAGYKGNGIVVAVIDSGVDGTHPDLQGQVIEGYRPLTNEVLSAGTDSSFGGAHGTHVAGTIAASENSLGIVGVAPEAKIMPIVIFDGADGKYIGDDEAAEGIIWAVDHGADILQNSWGGWGYSYTLKAAYDYALDNDVVVTVSAGNDHTDQHVHYPSGYPGIIQVAAVEYNGGNYRTTWFSNRSDAITVGAPGVSILSTVPLSTSKGYEGHSFEDSKGGLYDVYQGTSMACPHVSGVVALLKQKYPNAKVWQIRKLIEEGAVDIDEAGFDHSSGYGLINTKNSIGMELPTSGGIESFDVKVVNSQNNGISGVFVTLKRLEGFGGDYFAKTDSYGIAHFSNIDAGKYEIIAGGPDSNDRSYNGGYLGSYATRREEERQVSKILNLSTNTTQEFTFTSTFKFKFDAPSVSLGQATVTVDSALHEIVLGKRVSYSEEEFIPGNDYDYSNIAGLALIRIERSNVGATCTVNGTVTLNGYEIPVYGTFESTDATLATVDELGGAKRWWLLFGSN